MEWNGMQRNALQMSCNDIHVMSCKVVRLSARRGPRARPPADATRAATARSIRRTVLARGAVRWAWRCAPRCGASVRDRSPRARRRRPCVSRPAAMTRRFEGWRFPWTRSGRRSFDDSDAVVSAARRWLSTRGLSAHLELARRQQARERRVEVEHALERELREHEHERRLRERARGEHGVRAGRPRAGRRARPAAGLARARVEAAGHGRADVRGRADLVEPIIRRHHQQSTTLSSCLARHFVAHHSSRNV